MHVLMSMAEFERSMVRERTRAGVKAAKAAGKVLGRPRTLDAHRADILTLRATGLSMRAIAAKLTIPRAACSPPCGSTSGRGRAKEAGPWERRGQSMASPFSFPGMEAPRYP